MNPQNSRELIDGKDVIKNGDFWITYEDDKKLIHKDGFGRVYKRSEWMTPIYRSLPASAVETAPQQSETPRTDALGTALLPYVDGMPDYITGLKNWDKLSKQLETELNEARLIAESHCNKARDQFSQLADLLAQLAASEQSREAMRELLLEKPTFEGKPCSYDKEAQVRINTALATPISAEWVRKRELDKLREANARLMKERSDLANHVLVEDARHDQLLAAERERDSLRDALKRIHEDLSAVNEAMK